MRSLINAGITCYQSQGDADYHICNTATDLACGTDRAVILVGKDTDLLTMLIDRSKPNLFMQYARNAIYGIDCMKEALHPNVRTHLLATHAISGSDTVSAIYNVGKKKALKVLEQEVWEALSVFKKVDATHEEIAAAAEMFVLKLYNANHLTTSLDILRYVHYMRKMKTSTSSFQLQSLPPTSAAVKFHVFRAFFAVQEWLGNPANLQPTDWGWELHDVMLIPVYTDRPLAPQSVLRMVSRGCKTGYAKRCKCRKAGLDCSAMCSTCA